MVGQKLVTSKSNILIITKDNTAIEAIKAVLSGSEDMALAGVFGEVAELKSYLSKITIKAVIVDIDVDPTRVLYDLSEILHSHSEVYVIVLCSSFHKELALHAMQVGARNFLEKNSISTELSGIIQHFSKTEKKKSNSGCVISILSAGGGCGATTVAVNLANELKLLSSQPVMTIDLDISYGAISQYLGIKSQYGIADVLNRKDTIDNNLVQSSAFSFTKDFYVLVSPVSQDTTKTDCLEFEHLPRVIKSCRELYKYTLIDAPRVTYKTMLSLAGLSDIVIIVLQLTVKDVNIARSFVTTLTNSGITHQNIIALVNRFEKRGPLIKLDVGQKAIGLTNFYTIRNNWRKAIKSMTRGKPLIQVAKHAGLRSDFKKLAVIIKAYQAKTGGKS